MPPTPLTTTFCTESDLKLLLSQDGVDLRADDDQDGYREPRIEVNIISQAISYATTRVLFYCQPFYEAADLATSWLVNEWATIIACRWLCQRRNQPCPTALSDMHEEAIEDMKGVRKGVMQIPDIGKRFDDAPAWSNVTHDGRYRYARTRVEQSISEQSATQYGQHVDQASNFFEI